MARIQKEGRHWRARVARSHTTELTCSFPTRHEAEAWARMMARLIEEEELPDLATTRVADLVQRFLRENADTSRARFDCVLRSDLVSLRLAQLTPERLVAYRDDQLEIRPHGDVAAELVALEEVVETARRAWGFPFSENPLRRVALPRPLRSRIRRVPDATIALLEDAAGESERAEIIPLVRLALETGLRRAELCVLRRRQVDLRDGSLCVPASPSGSARTIPLSPRAKAILEALLANGRDQVFQLSPAMAAKRFTRLVKRARVPRLHFQDLRDEAIFRFFEQGMTCEEVARVTGHSDVGTLSVYRPWRIDKLAGINR